MTSPRDDKGTPAPPANFWDFLNQMGFPPPQQLLGEVQRLNGNIERLAPDLHQLASAGGSITDLTAALQKLNVDDVRKLTVALNTATDASRTLSTRLWPETNRR